MLPDTNRTRLVRKARPTESFFNFFSPPVPPNEDAIDNGDIEEIDLDTWNELDLEKAAKPEGWVDDEKGDEDEEEDLDEDEDEDDDNWEDDDEDDDDLDDDFDDRGE